MSGGGELRAKGSRGDHGAEDGVMVMGEVKNTGKTARSSGYNFVLRLTIDCQPQYRYVGFQSTSRISIEPEQSDSGLEMPSPSFSGEIFVQTICFVVHSYIIYSALRLEDAFVGQRSGGNRNRWPAPANMYLCVASNEALSISADAVVELQVEHRLIFTSNAC